MLYKSGQNLIKAENPFFQMVALSVIGDRAEQQDNFGYILKETEGIVVICDGMGGHDGGRIASDIAVKTFLNSYTKCHSKSEYINMLIEASKKADKEISALKNVNGDILNAGSTLVSIIIDYKNLIWCSVGDSRAYLIRKGEMVQLTQDHNYHTVLVEKKNAGFLNESQFEIEDVNGEALISFLGIGNLELIDYSQSSLDLQKDDKIIVMSDGLYKLLTDEEIARIIDNFNNISEAIQILEIKAGKKAKVNCELRDNMTVALIKIN